MMNPILEAVIVLVVTVVTLAYEFKHTFNQ